MRELHYLCALFMCVALFECSVLSRCAALFQYAVLFERVKLFAYAALFMCVAYSRGPINGIEFSVLAGQNWGKVRLGRFGQD